VLTEVNQPADLRDLIVTEKILVEVDLTNVRASRERRDDTLCAQTQTQMQMQMQTQTQTQRQSEDTERGEVRDDRRPPIERLVSERICGWVDRGRQKELRACLVTEASV
jgi:hypothetical protein